MGRVGTDRDVPRLSLTIRTGHFFLSIAESALLRTFARSHRLAKVKE